jgi:2-methylcitrate dehydratase PrpD
MNPRDLSHEFASFAANCRFEDLPPDAIDTAKKSILDMLGISLAASGTVPAVQSVVDLVRETGGTPECTVLGSRQSAPALMAAFANGAMAHALDFDDQGADGHHPSSSIIPAAFAAAELVRGVTGKTLITAVALGQDMFLRMRRNIGERQDWLMTTVLGVFSATASVSHVLGLNEEQTANALGIASLGSCGTLEMRYGRESDLGQLYAGFMAKTAVLSALLARKGVTGTQSLFEGKAGVLNVYFEGKYGRARMVANLGRTIARGTLQYKPWPVCGLAHTYIHATLEMLRKHKLTSSDISEVRVYVGDFQQRMCYPLEQRRRPGTAMDARFSIPFALGATIAHGELRIQQFTDEGLRDPAALNGSMKVIPVDDSSFDWKGTMPIARVDIVTVNGATLTGTGEGTPGNADCPMGWDDIAHKFASCAALAPHRPSEAVIAKAVAMATSLDKLDDATELMRSLSGAVDYLYLSRMVG